MLIATYTAYGFRNNMQNKNIKIQAITNKHKLFNQVKDFAFNCSWRVGKEIAQKFDKLNFDEFERIIIATNNSEICGFCTVVKKDCIPNIPYSPYISDLFVAENYRGNRLSQKLIEFSLKYLKSKGFNKVYIISDHVNLYEKYGFIIIDKQKAPWGSIESIFVKEI